jgi:hypothetical protein
MWMQQQHAPCFGWQTQIQAFVYAHVSNYEREITKGPYDNGM